MGWDLSTVSALLLAIGLISYVVLDGVSLGSGIMLPTLRKASAKTTFARSFAPVHLSNGLWLLMCALGGMVAFPAAFRVLLEALTIPISIMLVAWLVRVWSGQKLLHTSAEQGASYYVLFSVSALVIALSQGMMLGAVIQGMTLEGTQFIGNTWDWLTWFSGLTGITVVLTYALLGATWSLFAVPDTNLRATLRAYSRHVLVWCGYALMALQLIMPFLTDALRERWLTLPNFFHMGFVPMLALMAYVWVYYVIRFSEWKVWPFGIVLQVVGTAYFTLVTSLWPALVPPSLTLADAAAASSSLSLMLWSAVIIVPALIAYSLWRHLGFYRPNAGAKYAYGS